MDGLEGSMTLNPFGCADGTVMKRRDIEINYEKGKNRLLLYETCDGLVVRVEVRVNTINLCFGCQRMRLLTTLWEL